MPQKMKEAKSKVGRRGNNEGSIFQRKDGRWCGMVTIGYKTNGKPDRKSVYGSSRQEVAKKVTALSSEVYAKGYVTVAASKERNFEILFREWFDLFVAPGLASVTEENRRYAMKNHIFKAFGAMEVQNVDLKMLQVFFNAKVSAGLAPDTISKIKSLLNRFFIHAVREHYILVNPMTDVIIRKDKAKSNGIKKKQEKGKALRPEIRQKVFGLVAENTLLKPIIITFSFTGLRPQELIALKWENVNLDAKTISVVQAVNRTTEFDDEGNVVSRGASIGKTKTESSVRSFILPDIVIDVLGEWASYCKTNNINSEFVFPTLTGGMRTYSGLRSLLKRFTKIHGLEKEKITLYTLRHTFATFLLEQRENPKIVSKLMGHKKVSTTLDIYSHVVSNAVYEETAHTLDSVYAGFIQPHK